VHVSVIIETANGLRELFDEVVVTTPLGWLKRNKSAFSPCLSPRLAAAIDSIGFGNLDKVYIAFPRAFWIRTDLAYNGDGAPMFPIETLFLHPEYAPDSNLARCMQEMLSLALLPRPYAHATVMFYVFGEWGAHITKLVRGMAQDSPEYYKTLKTCFEPYYSCLPNFDVSSPDCTPRAFLSSDWQNDKFAGYGSYCNYQVGLTDGARDIEVMREGMGVERGIWFAGEHTALQPARLDSVGPSFVGTRNTRVNFSFRKQKPEVGSEPDSEPLIGAPTGAPTRDPRRTHHIAGPRKQSSLKEVPYFNSIPYRPG
jgi:hypothetical protein